MPNSGGMCTLRRLQPVLLDVDGDVMQAGLRALLEREGVACTTLIGQCQLALVSASRVRTQPPNLLVIALLEDASAESILEALAAGARGLLLRDDPIKIVTSAIDSILAGYGWITPRLCPALIDFLATICIPRPAPEISLLTPRQREVLELMTAGLTTSEIATQLGIKSGTVKLHVSAVLRKFGVGGRASAVARAVGRSYAE